MRCYATASSSNRDAVFPPVGDYVCWLLLLFQEVYFRSAYLGYSILSRGSSVFKIGVADSMFGLRRFVQNLVRLRHVRLIPQV